MRKTVVSVIVMVLLAAMSPVFAAGYPDKNPRLVVPYAAGGGTDVMARAVAQFMEEAHGRRVVVVNKPGAGGQIGTAEVAEARPDGYTMLITSSSDFLLAPLFSKDPGFALTDFTPVAIFNDTASSIIVKPDSPFKTFGDLVAFAKDNPGKVTLSTSGDAHILLAAIIEQVAGVTVSTVSYSGGGESMNAVMGGHVEAAIIDKRFITQTEQAGCKALGVASGERFAILPEVPTLKEQGYDITDNQHRVLLLPVKTPKEVIDVLTKAVLAFGNSKEFEDKLTSLNEVRKIETGTALADYMKAQGEMFSRIVEANREKFPLK